MTEATNRDTWRLWWQQVKPLRFWLGVIGSFSALANVASLGIPYGFKLLYDTLASGRQNYAPAVWWILGSEAATWLFHRVSELLDAHISTKANLLLSDYCFAATHRLPQQYFEEHPSGSIARQVNQYLDGFMIVYEQIVWNATSTLAAYLGVIIILGMRFWWFAAALIIWFFIYALAIWKVTLIKQRYDLARADADREAAGHLNDGLANQLAVRTNAAETREAAGYHTFMGLFSAAQRKALYIDTGFEAVQGALLWLIEAVLVVISIYGWRHGLVSLGDIILIQGYLLTLINHLWYLGRFYRRMYNGLADARNMATVFMNQPAEPVSGSRRQPLSGEINLQKVCFAYQPDRQIIRSFSLQIKAGERVALVGPSGGGKSTIVKLLLRLYSPQTGTITFDGIPAADLDTTDLRQQVAYVAQDPLLFHRSVLENIRYSRPKATLAQVKAAAAAAQAADFIKELPDGYNTIIGERGVKLSGGERQRIALARAFLQDAPIVLLDEPTSSLDSLSEELIQKAISKLMKGRTVMVIAHRLATIRQMDHIYVVQNGKISESGTHGELSELNRGLYRRLWQIQTK